jgi:hypothetical protein
MGDRIRNSLQRKVVFAAMVAGIVAVSGGLAVAHHLENRTSAEQKSSHKPSAASLRTPLPTTAKTPERAAAPKPAAESCNIHIHTTDPNAHISKSCSSAGGNSTASVSNHAATSGSSSSVNVSSQSSSSGGSNYSHSETTVNISN